jgi:hypothetical protein
MDLAVFGIIWRPCSFLGWVPVFTDASQSLAVMSIGFLLSNDDTAVVWRGPKKNAMIKQVHKIYLIKLFDQTGAQNLFDQII